MSDHIATLTFSRNFQINLRLLSKFIDDNRRSTFVSILILVLYKKKYLRLVTRWNKTIDVHNATVNVHKHTVAGNWFGAIAILAVVPVRRWIPLTLRSSPSWSCNHRNCAQGAGMSKCHILKLSVNHITNSSPLSCERNYCRRCHIRSCEHTCKRSVGVIVV